MRAREGGRRSLLGLAGLVLAALLAAVLWGGAPGAGAQGSSELVAQPVLDAPASTFLGASPKEAPGEVWAIAKDGTTTVRYTDAGGWERMPPPTGSDGGSLADLE